MKSIKKIKTIATPSVLRNERGSGFTLIELLVVIGIIAVLATIGTISFGNAASKSRDAKRQADIKTISNGLQIYNTRVGSFPTLTVASVWSSFLAQLGVSGATPPRVSGTPPEDYCYYRGSGSGNNGTEYILVASDFENTLPSDAITADATVFANFTLIADTSGTNTPVCDGRGSTAGPQCTAAGQNGGDDIEYCVKGSTAKLF